MLAAQADISELPQIPDASTAILKSSWSPEVVDAMAAKCADLLISLGGHAPEQHTIPGSLELPFAAQCLIESKASPLDAVICFGVVLKGATLHFEMVSHAVTQGLLDVSLRTSTPILNEVLAVVDLNDAAERSRDDHYNKGIEAAAAAARIIAWRRGLT